MQRDELIATLNKYKNIALNEAENIKLALVVSVLNETDNYSDFSSHSVTTSYLTRADCDELINAFRENQIYTELYTDFETFFNDYYSGNFNCNLVFESSPKGNAKGKDALLPVFCDSVNLRHIGPDGSSNLRCCNKFMWYCALRNCSIPVSDTYLYVGHWITNPPKDETFILKLNEECASIGLSADSVISGDPESITEKAKILYSEYNEPVIAQKFVSGYEVEVPVISNKNDIMVLPPVGLKYRDKKLLGETYFDYDTIYDNGYGTYLFEDYSRNVSDKLTVIAKSVVELLDLKGYFRIDFRIDEKDNPYVIDINNDPTLNNEGSFQFSINSLGFNKKDMLAILIGNALVNQSKTERR